MKPISTCLISALLAVGLMKCVDPAALVAVPHRHTGAPRLRPSGQSVREPLSDEQLVSKYSGRTPSEWGTSVPGVLTHIHTGRKVISLTFDACGGGKKGNGFDSKLLAYLERERIPSTLFLGGRWIDVNPGIARRLAANPLFEIENHGLHHKPCSVNGRSAYGIRGTSGIADVISEVDGNAEKIEAITHRRPRFYRSGTAMYDDVAAAIVREMGCTPVGFTISGDEGATLPSGEVRARLLKASQGDIVLCHMNRPEGQTAEGVMAAIPILRKRGFKFARLDQCVPGARRSNGSTPH